MQCNAYKQCNPMQCYVMQCNAYTHCNAYNKCNAMPIINATQCL